MMLTQKGEMLPDEYDNCCGGFDPDRSGDSVRSLSPRQMIDRDIWITANEMIKQFGEDAAVTAATRADAMRDLDDAEGYSVWKRVLEAIADLKNAVSELAVRLTNGHRSHNSRLCALVRSNPNDGSSLASRFWMVLRQNARFYASG
jgi:hypothetical protein